MLQLDQGHKHSYGRKFSLDDSVRLFLFQVRFFKSNHTKNKKRQVGVQEINIIDLVKPITKFSKMVTDPNKINYYLEKAYHLSKSGRPGPVF